MCSFESRWKLKLFERCFGPVAQLVRAPPCHGGGRRFDPVPGRFFFNLIKNTVGVLAQLGEHLPYKQRVIGSSPIGPIFQSIASGLLPIWLNWQSS